MSTGNLYIPNKIVVGFQERQGTYTGKLAYVIYRDHTGTLRKEKSWNNWRDKKIESVEFDNTPQNGFTFNKGVQRDRRWSGGGRSMFRIWDPRDFEFEITVDNTIAILTHSDISKRDIAEQCVFAWNGTELILLPVNSEEYQSSLIHTARQAVEFKVEDLVVGHSYVTKKEGDTVVYMGRHDVFEWKHEYSESYGSYNYGHKASSLVKKKSKAHTFYIAPKTIEYSESYSYTRNEEFIVKADPKTYIAESVEGGVHADYPSLVEKFNALGNHAKVVSLEIEPYEDKIFKNSTVGGWLMLSPTEAIKFQTDSAGNVAWKKAARFDGKVIHLSHPSEKNQHYSPYTYGYRSGQQYCPQYDLPGLGSHDERVNAIITDMETMLRNGGFAQSVDASDVEGNAKIRLANGELLRQMCHKYNVGYLYAKLADGTRAKDKSM